METLPECADQTFREADDDDAEEKKEERDHSFDCGHRRRRGSSRGAAGRSHGNDVGAICDEVLGLRML